MWTGLFCRIHTAAEWVHDPGGYFSALHHVLRAAAMAAQLMNDALRMSKIGHWKRERRLTGPFCWCNLPGNDAVSRLSRRALHDFNDSEDVRAAIQILSRRPLDIVLHTPRTGPCGIADRPGDPRPQW